MYLVKKGKELFLFIQWGPKSRVLLCTIYTLYSETRSVRKFGIFTKKMLFQQVEGVKCEYVPADIQCCHRWSGRGRDIWSLACNVDGIEFCIFRHIQGCTLWQIWFWLLVPDIRMTRFGYFWCIKWRYFKTIFNMFWSFVDDILKHFWTIFDFWALFDIFWIFLKMFIWSLCLVFSASLTVNFSCFSHHWDWYRIANL